MGVGAIKEKEKFRVTLKIFEDLGSAIHEGKDYFRRHRFLAILRSGRR